ncbi:hypothetical protein IE077_002288, partial [Cardiosporidium cionae]
RIKASTPSHVSGHCFNHCITNDPFIAVLYSRYTPSPISFLLFGIGECGVTSSNMKSAAGYFSISAGIILICSSSSKRSGGSVQQILWNSLYKKVDSQQWQQKGGFSPPL